MRGKLSVSKSRAPAYVMVERCGKPGGGKGPLIQAELCNTVATTVRSVITLFQPLEVIDDTDEIRCAPPDSIGV